MGLKEVKQRPCVEMLEGWYGVDASKLDIAAVAAERAEMPKDQWAIKAETLRKRAG